MIPQELGFAFALLALLHLYLQGLNRHYLVMDDGPLKTPLNIGWFIASVLLPALGFAAFWSAPPVRDALTFAPRGLVSSILLGGVAGLGGLMLWRAALWLWDRAHPRRTPHLLAEEVSYPRIENPVRKLPCLPRSWETTTSLEIIRRELEVPGLPPEFDGLVIAHIGDIHYDPPSGLVDYYEEVCDYVNDLRPDLVAHTGDFVSAARHIARAANHAARYRGRLGSYAVLGNHDYWTRPGRLVKALGRTPIVYLGNSRRVFTRGGRRLVLAGTDAPWDHQAPDWPRLLAKGPADAAVLLSHTPDNAPEAARHGANLVLSGHNHGGQVCLPLLGPVVVPSRTGHSYVSGVYRVSDTCLLNVTRGVGVTNVHFRVLCPPEVTVLRLRAVTAEAMVGATALRRLPNAAPVSAAGGFA